MATAAEGHPRDAAPGPLAEADVHAQEDRARPLLALSVGGSLALALAGQASPELAWLTTVGMLWFIVVGIGSAPWQLVRGLGLYERMALSFLTSMSLLAGLSMVMLSAGVWLPKTATLVLGAVSVPLHLRASREAAGLLRRRYRLHRDAATRHPRPRGSRGAFTLGPRWSAHDEFIDARPSAVARTSAIWWNAPRRGGWLAAPTALTGPAPAITAALAAAVCLASALLHRHLVPGYYGFLPRIGALWYLGLALIVVTAAVTCLGWSRDPYRSVPEWCRATPVILLVVVLTATPALTYDGPRVQAAAKHIDFVVQILSEHRLASATPIYNAYPGFFSSAAWLCDVSGIPDPLSLAIAWPVVLGLFRVMSLRVLAGAVLRDPALSWVAVTIAVLVDSLGLDYFSPQSLGFVLGVITLGLALGSRPATLRLPMVLLGGLTLTVTHQLSPFVIGGVLVVLAALRLVRPWWVPGLVLVPASAWAALHWDAVRSFVRLDRFGSAGNFRPPRTVAAAGLDRLAVVDHAVVALVAGILLCCLLAAVALWRHRRSRLAWASVVCPAVGMVAVAVNPYGQEGIFRAALFGIPWVALLAARLFASPRLRTALILGGTYAALTATFLVSDFALDAVNVIRPSDLSAVRSFEALGGPRPQYPYYLLVLMPGDQPTVPATVGGRHFMWSRERIGLPAERVGSVAPRTEMELLTRRFVSYTDQSARHAQLYALWSPVGAEYGRAYGLQTTARARSLRDAFVDAPFWAVQARYGDTYLLRFEPAQETAAAAGE